MSDRDLTPGDADPRAPQQITLEVDDPAASTISAVLHPAPSPTVAVLLLPGAGGTYRDEGLVALAESLAAAGCLVVRANLPYREGGRRVPPPAERSVGGLRSVLHAADRYIGGSSWILGGRSYGGRVASMAVAEAAGRHARAAASAAGASRAPDHSGVGATGVPGVHVRGLLCVSYPLHPPGRQDRLRVAHWSDIEVPTLLVQGTHDDRGGPEVFEQHIDRFGGPVRVVWIQGADHQLRIRGRDAADGRPRSPSRVTRDVADTVVAWCLTADPSRADGVWC